MKLILKTGLLAAMVFAVLGATSAQAAIYGGSLGGINACLAGKAKCVIKMKSCLLGCYGKAAGGGAAADPACLDKCRNGFLADPVTGKGCWEKLDTKNGVACGPSLGVAQAAVVKAKIEAYAYNTYRAIVPSGGTLLNKCAAGKLKCVSKYNACVLGIIGKAFKAGLPIGSLAKCDAILTSGNVSAGGKLSCIGKLETKNPLGSAAACVTFADEGALRTGDDAFVNDILYGFLAGTEQNMNTKRCTNNTFVQCNVDGDCGAGTCQFYFGGPLPLSAGGTSTCIFTRWNGSITGTFNVDTGASGGTANVLSEVFLAPVTAHPCPQCVGVNEIPNDGVTGGTCDDGTRVGLACDSNGESPVPAFGKTSLDCPIAGAPLVTLPVNLSNSNVGTTTRTIGASSPNCNGDPGKKCMCSVCTLNNSVPCFTDAECITAAAGTCIVAGGPGTGRAPNACVDDTSTGANEDNCTVTAGGDGLCSAVVDNSCNTEKWRSCAVDADCTLPGDTCITRPRSCLPGYDGVVGNTITATGSAGTPHNHTGRSTFASVFCVAHTGAAAIDNAAGLPGPGRLVLGGAAAEDGVTGVSCPTVATFLPTSSAGALDTGWTGLAHKAQVVGQGKVTVGVTGCSGVPPASCGTCTYTGPVPNL